MELRGWLRKKFFPTEEDKINIRNERLDKIKERKEEMKYLMEDVELSQIETEQIRKMDEANKIINEAKNMKKTKERKFVEQKLKTGAKNIKKNTERVGKAIVKHIEKERKKEKKLKKNNILVRKEPLTVMEQEIVDYEKTMRNRKW